MNGESLRCVRNAAFLACLVTCLAAGCGGSGDQLETAPVSGTVSYNGELLKIGSLLFVPEDGGPSAQGKIEEDGSYTMGTYTATDGAILGKHKVMITAMTSEGGSGLPEDAVDGNAGAVSIIPEHYGDLENSGLFVVVVAGDNERDFELKD